MIGESGRMSQLAKAITARRRKLRRTVPAGQHDGMYGQAHHMTTGILRRRLQPGGTCAATVSAARGRPTPVTGARTRWHGVRSPAHKTFRRRRVQSGDQPTWTAAAFTRKHTSRNPATSTDEEEQAPAVAAGDRNCARGAAADVVRSGAQGWLRW